jgi:transposase
MLGPRKGRCLDRSVLVSLEALVPRNHFYRQLEAKLDLCFVRDLTHHHYEAIGRPSIDPVVFFKLQLIMFFEGIRSERRLMEVSRLNLAHRWYLGYHLDEPLPEHSSLTRIRDRLGVETFQQFFERIVDVCQAAGLVWGKELIFDATQVRANAGLNSLVPRFYLRAKQHLEELFATGSAEATPSDHKVPDSDQERLPTLEAAPLEPESVPGALPWRGTADEQTQLAATNRAVWKLLELRRLDPERDAAHGYQRKSALHVSQTDPDAALMQLKGGGPMVLGYHDHYVVDGGKARIILEALVTPADVMENTPMLDLLWRARFRWQIHPKRVIGDTTYGTADNIRILEEAGIRAYVPLPDWDGRTPYFGPSSFTYDPERDVYHCPQGQPLHRYRTDYVPEVHLYRAAASTCNSCPIKNACTASDQGRTVTRSFHAASLDRVRAYHATPAYQKAMRKRAVWVEPLFGEAKDWHGLRRFRLRGLTKVNCEALLVAAGQNVKHWLTATKWKPRPPPCTSVALTAAAS